MNNSENKICQNCKVSFVIDAQDFEFYEKMKVPAPSWCPECRARRRFVFRNERNLSWNKSAISGKSILSLYPSGFGVPVYTEKEWWSDDWDAMEYGRDYDFSKPFLQQIGELDRVVPHYNLNVFGMLNSDYSANASYLKNCYLLFNSNKSEDCAYGNAINNSYFCFDNSHIVKCELCYMSFWLFRCYQAHFSSHCEDCNNIWFSKNCRGCSNCFGCINLRNKSYHIFNKEYSKKEYSAKLDLMNLARMSGITTISKVAQDFWLKFPNKFIQGTHNTNVTGEYISNSKNVTQSYLVREGENLKYVQYLQIPPNKDCYDVTVGVDNNQLAYEIVVGGLGLYNSKFCYDCWPEVRDLEYCMFCKSSSNLFGCVGLRKKEYCILNKQYKKEEYYRLRKKIIKHMDEIPYMDKGKRVYRYGEFFPPELATIPYNFSIAQDHFPLTKQQAIDQGYKWKDQEQRTIEPDIHYKDLPDSISDDANYRRSSVITDKGETILCKGWDENQEKASEHNCTKVFKIIPQELDFYKKMNLPLPRYCPNCRHYHRIQQRNPLKLYKRKCMNKGCDTEFLTTYAPDRPEIAYCEKCYLKEVV